MNMMVTNKYKLTGWTDAINNKSKGLMKARYIDR